MPTTNNNKKRIQELIILSSIIIISFLLWDTFILFPIKLFVVFLHESSHAISCILTGGKVINMDIGLDLGGKCELTGGNIFIIAFSGYLGSFLFGSILFYSAYLKKYRLPIISLITTIIVLTAINLTSNSMIQIFSIFFSIGLLVSVKYLPEVFNKYLMISLGLISCLYVIFDIKEDVFNQTFSPSDATIIAQLTGVPEFIWGLLWIGISFTGLFFLFRIAYTKRD